jgi:hypothetical protein
MQKQEKFLFNAKFIKARTGWDNKELERARKNNPDFWEVTKKGRYLYNFNLIPKELLKQTV